MKRRELERHLRAPGAHIDHEGAKPTWWRGPAGPMATVPRHREIKTGTARAICRQLGVPTPRGSQ